MIYTGSLICAVSLSYFHPKKLRRNKVCQEIFRWKANGRYVKKCISIRKSVLIIHDCLVIKETNHESYIRKS